MGGVVRVKRATRACLGCGMLLSASTRACPKCDGLLAEQTDGSTVRVDIAHHGERVHDAERKLRELLDEAVRQPAAELALVVGGGAIKENTLMMLEASRRSGHIFGFRVDEHNPGLIRVQVKRTGRRG